MNYDRHTVFYPGILSMKKHLFNKGLLSAVAILATIACASCQRKATTPAQPKEPSSQVSPSSQFNCDESEEGCNVEEAGEEAMIHVIEIDQPETTNVTEENSATVPVLESSTEVGAAPAETTVEAAAASTPVETSVSETVSAPAAAAETTAAIAVQVAETPKQETKEE